MTFKEKRQQKKEKLRVMEEALTQMKEQLKIVSSKSGVDALQRKVDFYKLASSRGSMAKKACDLIEIRKELGDSPEITAIEESILDVNKVKSSRRLELIRRTIYVILAYANLIFLGKYTEVKNSSAIDFYSLITFWCPIIALCNPFFDDIKQSDVEDKYEENMKSLIKAMKSKGVSPDGFALTKKFKEKM